MTTVADGGRRRRALRVAGSVCLGLGVLAITWAAVIWLWGDPLTALYTSREQRNLSRAYEARERAFAVHLNPASRATPDRAAIRRTARLYHRELTTGSPLGRIRVPELGLDMVVVAGTDTASLRKGPGWDERTFLPGEGELVYIAGHRTTYKAPFGHIDRLKQGDLVELTLPYGRFAYRVTRTVIVPANDLARLDSRGVDEVALQACHPRFSAKERYIVYGRLASVSQPRA